MRAGGALDRSGSSIMGESMKVQTRVTALGLLAAAVGGLLLNHAAIPQPETYHAFADGRSMFGVPNAMNVLSNLPFLLGGLWGLIRAGKWQGRLEEGGERVAYLGFFAGVTLTSLGSSYYHWAPDSMTLFWDRMPMAMAFMSLFAAQLGERVDPRLSKALWGLLVLLGLLSVVYWEWTERAGHGDLRPYVFVQGFPILAMVVMLLAFPGRYDGAGWLWGTIGLYVVAKLLETYDKQVFGWTGGLVSGHSLKHLSAGVATALVVPMLERRRRVSAQP
jgi:hypothetical protein